MTKVLWYTLGTAHDFLNESHSKQLHPLLRGVFAANQAQPYHLHVELYATTLSASRQPIGECLQVDSTIGLRTADQCIELHPSSVF